MGFREDVAPKIEADTKSRKTNKAVQARNLLNKKYLTWCMTSSQKSIKIIAPKVLRVYC
nr:unnamed protein product [Callosobruchus chinensis]